MNPKRSYCVYNQTREAFLSFKIARADTSVARLKGLFGRIRLNPDEGLWLVPACGVHTIGLPFAIDVIYLDADYRVIHLVEYLRPFRLTSIRLRSESVLELPPHTIYASQTKLGDRLLICPPDEIGNHLPSQKGAAAIGVEA